MSHHDAMANLIQLGEELLIDNHISIDDPKREKIETKYKECLQVQL